MNIPCPQTENQNNFRHEIRKWLGTSNICNIIRDIRVRTLKETWHLTPQLAQSRNEHCWFEFTSYILYIVWIKFLRNKNWKYLVVWTIKLSFSGLGQENQCSSYSVVHVPIPPFSPYWYNFIRSDPAYFNRKTKVGYIPFTLSII